MPQHSSKDLFVLGLYFSVSQHSIAEVILIKGDLGHITKDDYLVGIYRARVPGSCFWVPHLDADRDVDLDIPELQLAT